MKIILFRPIWHILNVLNYLIRSITRSDSKNLTLVDFPFPVIY